MPWIKQELCQNSYRSVYLYFMAIIAYFKRLLNTHENGHICSKPDDVKKDVNDLNACMLQNIKGAGVVPAPSIGEFYC